MTDEAPSHASIERAFRDEHARVFAALVRRLGDFEAASDALQEAYVSALRDWAIRGIPERKGAWLTTVAFRAAIDARRRTQREADPLPDQLAIASTGEDDDIPDDRLRLIFSACHPALAPEARVALTLQTMCGLTAHEIGRLLLLPKATVAQQLVRAKRKIRDARIPFELPKPEAWDDRVGGVLSVVYLLFTEGYLATRGPALMRPELADEALHLARVLHHLAPAEPEIAGLLALLVLHDARRRARVGDLGELVPLDAQDRSLWDRAAIAEATTLLEGALERGRSGPFQIQAAIAALHAEASSVAATDWRQIALLYAALREHDASLAAALGHAVALGMADGADAGLAVLAGDVAERGRENHHFFAVRGELRARAGDAEGARADVEAALALATNEAEIAHLRKRRRALE